MAEAKFSLTQRVEATREYWSKPFQQLDPFTVTLSCILSQQIRFAEGKAIRANLYAKYKTHILDPVKIVAITDTEWQTLGRVTDKRIQAIREVCLLFSQAHMKQVMVKDLQLVKGIGDWTVKSVLVMLGLGDFFLYEDKWIQSHLQRLAGKKMTLQELDAYLKYNYSGKYSDLTKFFWRLKPLATTKEKLTAEDFL